jgi:hypothetical protein
MLFHDLKDNVSERGGCLYIDYLGHLSSDHFHKFFDGGITLFFGDMTRSGLLICSENAS